MLLPFGLKGNMHLNICLSLPIQKENIRGKRIGYCIWFYAHRMIEQIFPQKCAKYKCKIGLRYFSNMIFYEINSETR